MSRKALIFFLSAAFFFAALEAVILLGIRVSPPYPGMSLTPKEEAQVLEKGEYSCTFQKMTIAETGEVCANFFFDAKGKTKDKLIYYGILSEEERNMCVNQDSPARKVKEVVSAKGIFDLQYYAVRRFLMIRQTITAPGVYYFATVVPKESRLVPRDLYYFVASIRAKLRSFWPYLLMGARNALLSLLTLGAGLFFSRRLRLLKRLAVMFFFCGIAAALLSFTPEEILFAAKTGPHGRLLFKSGDSAELKGSDVISEDVMTLAPYAAFLAKVKGHTTEGKKGLVFCDLYKAPAYDSDDAEYLMSFCGDKPRERYFALDTLHSFQKKISIRLFLFNFGQDAFVDGYEYWEIKLPPILIKIVLAMRNSLTPAFPIVWLCLFSGVVILLLYLMRGLVSKLTVLGATAFALFLLFLPVYCFGREEAIVERTPTRFYMAGEPLCLYAVRWRNTPNPEKSGDETILEPDANFYVQAFNDKEIGGANSLYPDGRTAFTKYFTRFYSGLKINVYTRRVRMTDVRHVKISPSLLIVKAAAWLWILILVFGGLFQIFKTIVGRAGEKA